MAKVRKMSSGSFKKNRLKKRLHGSNGDTESLELRIPQEATIPPSNLFDHVIVDYGVKGVGKTSLFSQIEDSLLMGLEPGRKNVRVRQIPDPNRKERIRDWWHFREYLDYIVRKRACKILGIDTIDRAYDLCMKAVCEGRNITHPGEVEDYGASWNAVKREFDDAMTGLRNHGLGLWFISHQKSRDFTPAVGQPYQMMIPSCSAQAMGYLEEAADFVFYHCYYNRRRVICVRGNNQVFWESLGDDDRFRHPNGKELAMIPMGRSPKQAHDNLVLAYNNELKAMTLERFLREEGYESEPEESGEKKPKKKFSRVK